MMIRISALRRTALAVTMLCLASAAGAQDVPSQPPPVPVFGGEAPTIANPQPDHPAYADLIDAIDETVDKSTLISNGLAAIKRQMEANPDLASAEAVSPGILDEIVGSMRPVLERQNLRVTALYRPKMIGAMADYLTPDEAASVAGFYRSDIGRKLMGSVVANFNMDQTMASAMSEKPITETEVRADITSAVTQGLQQMDSKDLAEMGRQAFSNPALLKLQRVNPKIQRLRAEMENEALTPEEDATIGKLIQDIFARRFPQ
jgi:hypothetical protein